MTGRGCLGLPAGFHALLFHQELFEHTLRRIPTYRAYLTTKYSLFWCLLREKEKQKVSFLREETPNHIRTFSSQPVQYQSALWWPSPAAFIAASLRRQIASMQTPWKKPWKNPWKSFMKPKKVFLKKVLKAGLSLNTSGDLQKISCLPVTSRFNGLRKGFANRFVGDVGQRLQHETQKVLLAHNAKRRGKWSRKRKRRGGQL